MKKYSLHFGALAVLIIMSSAAQAAGNIASVSVTPANPTFGQTVKFKVATSTPSECWANVSVQNTAFGLISYDAHVTNATIQAGSGETVTVILDHSGTYTIVAGASTNQNPKCAGQAKLTFEVKRTKFYLPAGPTVCPDPYKIKYGKGTGSSPTDFEKGEATCTKPAPECPAGFTAEFSTQTAILQCTPIITATCPPGWTGGAYNHKLICTSIKQPHVSCPTSDKWEWGTHYDTESWNSMGCYPNNKPAY